jgi:hypothetical protein
MVDVPPPERVIVKEGRHHMGYMAKGGDRAAGLA